MLPHREQAASSSQNMSVLGRNGEFEKEDVIPGPIHSVFPETGYGSEAAAGRLERGAQAVARPGTEAGNWWGHRGDQAAPELHGQGTSTAPPTHNCQQGKGSSSTQPLNTPGQCRRTNRGEHHQNLAVPLDLTPPFLQKIT